MVNEAWPRLHFATVTRSAGDVNPTVKNYLKRTICFKVSFYSYSLHGGVRVEV